MRLRGNASRFTLAVLVAGLALGACGSSKNSSSGGGSSTAHGTPITIGVVGTASGPQASSSGQYETVAPAWEAWVNANGGINGHPVKVITEDDGGNAATAQSQVTTSLDTDHVVAIVVASDNEVTAFDGAATSKGVPLISGAANSPDWYTKVGMFPTPTGVVQGLSDQVAAAKAAGGKVFANLYCAEIAACQQASPLLQSAAKSAGLGYVQLSVSSTSPSYTSQCVELQQKKVDYAQLNFTTSAAVKFIQDCQAQGYNPTWGSSEQAVGPSLYSLPNLTLFGPAYAFPSTADAPPAANFRTVMGKYAKDSNWKEGTGSFTWDGLMALDSALKTATAGGASATAASVGSGLYSLKGSTLNGELANPIGWIQGKSLDLLKYNPCYFTLEVKNGQLTAPNGLTPQCPATSS